jgi:hypothetical protein
MAIPLLAIAGLAAEFLPGLVKHLAGDKAGEVAEKIGSAVTKMTGKDDPDEASAILRANPDLVIALRRDMAAFEVELEKAYLADRQDARARDVAIHAMGRRNWRADIMLVCATASLVYIIYAINGSIGKISGEVLAIFNMAIGALLKMIGDAFAFEFGSSRSSKDKDAAIIDLARR